MADNMLIDGLIKFCDEKSKNIKLKAEPQVFVEIKQALEELKAYKSDGFTDHLLNTGYTKGYRNGIDEFAEQLNNSIDMLDLNYEYRCDGGVMHNTLKNMKETIQEIAEQMKAGGK